mmetsp:Transcript_36220/g.88727  ORF Transcript_36220/g.88727 Transcript_36220/m.88727 type:complete len:110 (-) Transcript_36220:60-389(-)
MADEIAADPGDANIERAEEDAPVGIGDEEAPAPEGEGTMGEYAEGLVGKLPVPGYNIGDRVQIERSDESISCATIVVVHPPEPMGCSYDIQIDGVDGTTTVMEDRLQPA